MPSGSTYRLRRNCYTLAARDQALADKANATTGGMTTLVLASMLAAIGELLLVDSCADSRPPSCSLASVSSSDNGTSSASQIALSSSLEASLRPRSTSERYPRLTRAASATGR